MAKKLTTFCTKRLRRRYFHGFVTWFLFLDGFSLSWIVFILRCYCSTMCWASFYGHVFLRSEQWLNAKSLKRVLSIQSPIQHLSTHWNVNFSRIWNWPACNLCQERGISTSLNIWSGTTGAHQLNLQSSRFMTTCLNITVNARLKVRSGWHILHYDYFSRIRWVVTGVFSKKNETFTPGAAAKGTFS